MQTLQPPAAFDELGSEPIEQLRMRRPRTLKTKIAGRSNDPATEVILPDAIDQDASSQRIGRAGQPVGQCQASTGRLNSVFWFDDYRLRSGQHRRSSWFHEVARYVRI